MIALLLVASIALCGFEEAWLNAKINARTWTVCDYDECPFKDLDEVKAMLIQPDEMIAFYSTFESDKTYRKISVPDNYDPRTTDKAHCYHPIRNQMKCGSCWAFAASETLSDRYCLLKNIDVVLSPQDLVSCDTILNKGCEGGNPLAAWEYAAISGIVSDACYPYVSGNGTTGSCEIKSKACVNPAEKFLKYKSSQPTSLSDKTKIKEALLVGSVEASMMVYDDFPTYKGGIYVKTSSAQFLGGHAVKIVGYGIDEKTSISYWIVANSWDTSFGENGYFRIKMAECSIDSAVTYANPK
jgi:cathepsin B